MVAKKAPKKLTLKGRWKRWRTYRNERGNLKRNISNAQEYIKRDIYTGFRKDNLRGKVRTDIAAQHIERNILDWQKKLKGLKKKHYSK